MFLGGKRGRVDRYAADRSVKRLACRAGVIKRISRHSLRASFATASSSTDLPPKATGQVLGHSRTAQVDEYLRVLRCRQPVATARTDDARFGPPARDVLSSHEFVCVRRRPPLQTFLHTLSTG